MWNGLDVVWNDLAAINAARVVFLEIEPAGCYFHLQQAFLKAKKLSLTRKIWLKQKRLSILYLTYLIYY